MISGSKEDKKYLPTGACYHFFSDILDHIFIRRTREDMTPRTPPKRRLSQGQFPTLYTPVTAKKVRIQQEGMPSGSSQSQTQTQTQTHAEPPLTPTFTPHKSQASRGATAPVTPNQYSSSPSRTPRRSPRSAATNARLKLEALSKSLNAPEKQVISIEPPKPTGLGIREPQVDANLSLHIKQQHSIVPLSSASTPFLGPPTERTPGTPRGKIIEESDVSRFAKLCHPQHNQFDSSEELLDDEVTSKALINPFVEPKKRTTPLINPFQSSKQPTRTDYSSKLELFNSRTGKYTVLDLSEKEKRIKPKKLDFGAATNNKVNDKRDTKEDESLDDKMGKKYLMKNLKGFMIDIQPKNSLGFEIFNDDKD